MNPVIVCEDFDPDIIKNLSSMVKEVIPMVSRLSRGISSLEEFDNQIVDFDEDVALGDIPRPELTSFSRYYTEDVRVKKIKNILGEGNEDKVQFRNFFYYPPNTMMTWHTNSNAIGTRVYYTMVSGGDIFRYRDPYTKEIIDVRAKDGWNSKKFKIGNTVENRLWHTIY